VNIPINGDKIPEEFNKVRSQVKKWIIEAGCRFTPSKGSNWVWGYGVRKVEQGFTVCQLSEHPEVLILSLAADLIEYQQLFETLSLKKRKELVFDIRLALLNQDVESEVPDDLKLVRLQRELFVDDLNRTQFWDKVFHIWKAMLAVTYLVERCIPLDGE
jgi:hypothetical protein